MKFPRLRRALQNLALSAVSLMLCFAVLEVVLRFCGYGNVEIYEPDPVLYWKLKPNQNCYTKVDRKVVHVNSLGTRGPEFAPSKPPNALRILCLGDSRTFGWGLSESETYCGMLQRLLQAHAGFGKKVEVINAGVNAWSYPQMQAYFRDVGVHYHPDFVVLEGANYWTQFGDKNGPEFVSQFMTRVRLKNFLRRFAIYHYFVEVKLHEYYSRYRTKFIPVDPAHDSLFKQQQQKDPDGLFRSAIEALCRLAQSNASKPVLLHLPALDELNSTNLSRDVNIKSDVSRRLNVPLLDLTSDLRLGGKSLYLEADPVHPNAEGNKIIAQRLLETLEHLVSP
jgi:lysophospholipase L1-like esterase